MKMKLCWSRVSPKSSDWCHIREVRFGVKYTWNEDGHVKVGGRDWNDGLTRHRMPGLLATTMAGGMRGRTVPQSL